MPRGSHHATLHTFNQPVWKQPWDLDGYSTREKARAAARKRVRRMRERRKSLRSWFCPCASCAGSSSLAVFLVWIFTLAVITLCPGVVAADVLALALDTSGSMKSHGKFDAAKDALVKHIKDARPGDVLFVIAFDTNDYPLGRLAVGEDGSDEIKKELIAKVQNLKAKGLHTNLDEPLQAAKAFLLEERAPGVRKIIVLSDGISDPSPDHVRLDLDGIAEMIPQELGWAVYVVGLPEDIAGLFQVQPQETETIVVAPKSHHIKGIALEQFSREKIEEAVSIAKEDVPVSPPVPALPLEPIQEVQTAQKPISLPVVEQEVASEVEETTRQPLPFSSLLPWLVSAAVLVLIGSALGLLRPTGGRQFHTFILELQKTAEETEKIRVSLKEKEKKTIGPHGNILLTDPDLPPVVCTLLWSGGQLWLTPQDSISVNSRPITIKTAVGIGDVIRVRDKITIMIDEEEKSE